MCISLQPSQHGSPKYGTAGVIAVAWIFSSFSEEVAAFRFPEGSGPTGQPLTLYLPACPSCVSLLLPLCASTSSLVDATPNCLLLILVWVALEFDGGRNRVLLHVAISMHTLYSSCSLGRFACMKLFLRFTKLATPFNTAICLMPPQCPW